jgi:hypothetical protein
MNVPMLNVLDLVKFLFCLNIKNCKYNILLGLIRSIDMIRREIHVIIPDRSLPKSMINALVKGYDDCPDEFYFMSIDRVKFEFNLILKYFYLISSGVVICLLM